MDCQNPCSHQYIHPRIQDPLSLVQQTRLAKRSRKAG